MENASNALLIAGGILLALMVIGALVLMFNQIGAYQESNSASEKASQLAQFNLDFEKYTDDNMINGTDIISLANKIIDYNKKDGITNSVDYDIKMSLTVRKMGNFRNQYGYGNVNEALFKQDVYVISESAGNKNILKEILDTYNNTDRKLLQKLSSMYNNNNKVESIKNIREALVQMHGESYKNWDGTTEPTLNQIRNFKEYSEFKSSKFKVYQESVYENGQIRDLYFEFVR